MSERQDRHQESVELFLGGLAMVCYGTVCVLFAPLMVAFEVVDFCASKRKEKK